MKIKTLTLAAGMAGLLVAPGAVPHLAAQSKNTATIWVRVQDGSGRPATDLRGTDFKITVDGGPGRISAVRYAGNPRRVVVIVDDTGAIPVIPLRAGLVALVDDIPADDEVALVTMSGQLHVLAEPTTDRELLRSVIGRISANEGTSVLMDALAQSNDRFLGKEDRMGVFVVVASEGPEASGIRDEVFNKFVQSFAAKGSTAHAVLMSASARGDVPRQRDVGNRRVDNAIQTVDTTAESIIAMNVTKNSGGRYELVNAATAIPDKLKSIAADIKADRRGLAGWYKIDLAVDKAPKGIRVEMDRSDMKVALTQNRPRLAPAASR